MGIEPVSQWQKQQQVLGAHFTTVPLWLLMSCQLVLLCNLWLNVRNGIQCNRTYCHQQNQTTYIRGSSVYRVKQSSTQIYVNTGCLYLHPYKSIVALDYKSKKRGPQFVHTRYATSLILFSSSHHNNIFLFKCIQHNPH